MKGLVRCLPFAVMLTAAMPAAAQDFRYPSPCHDGCMTVTAYYDYGGQQDWNCGAQTYAGHRGTDFAPYGSFSAMDEGRDIVAAASGEVIAAHDGEFDRCTSGSCSGGGGFGNYVAIRHDDGKVLYYAHMKRGSVAVAVGDRAGCGEHLGQIGSSGYSTGPHLHFEPRVGGSSDDPFGGVDGCSGPQSWWAEQGDYRALPAEACAEEEPPATDDAAVESVEPRDARVEPEAELTARVVMRNTGTTTWSHGEEVLLAFDGGEEMGVPEHLPLGEGTVAPDETYRFEVALRAPSEAGEYEIGLQMDRPGATRFGERAEIRLVVEPADDAEPSCFEGEAAAWRCGLPAQPTSVPIASDAGMAADPSTSRAHADRVTGGCRAAGGEGGNGGAVALAIGLLVLRRRRRLSARR